MSDAILTPSTQTPAEALAALLAASPSPILTETHLRLFWEEHILHKPKGRQPPTATFDFGTLNQVVFAKLQVKDEKWINVTNRILWPTDVATHWDLKRRIVLYEIIDNLPAYLRNAYEVAPGNKEDPWLNPVLLTHAPGGMYVPVAVMPGNGGVMIRSFITPVALHKMKRFEKLAK